MRTCAIHQPNFFPWMGYFDKLARADVFVLLDDVDFSRGSLMNRVRIGVRGKPAWATCPVKRGGKSQRIRNLEVDDRIPWRRKLLRTLRVEYARAPNFEDTIEELTAMIELPIENLADFNAECINRVHEILGLETEVMRQSELGITGKATELLARIVKATECDTYLCGGGSVAYQRDEVFRMNGLGLIYQNYAASPYGDPERFIPGLSVIDYLMNEGHPL